MPKRRKIKAPKAKSAKITAGPPEAKSAKITDRADPKAKSAKITSTAVPETKAAKITATAVPETVIAVPEAEAEKITATAPEVKPLSTDVPVPPPLVLPPLPTPPVITRKTGFFRGRRSKAQSSRNGRKEIIYRNEAIDRDPEDIRGFKIKASKAKSAKITAGPPEAKLAKIADPAAPKAKSAKITATAVPEAKSAKITSTAVPETKATKITATAVPEAKSSKITSTAVPETAKITATAVPETVIAVPEAEAAKITSTAVPETVIAVPEAEAAKITATAVPEAEAAKITATAVPEAEAEKITATAPEVKPLPTDGPVPPPLVLPPLPPPPVITRKTGFFRGRRSKAQSSRNGRKEIIHRNEAIDPEDIRGFEHVEKYVTPDGSKLPKFWDSEDELSDDDSCDNFRRIMCGFGTNCRLHEVIRPASEIVRRLKELQNTFGASRTMALLPKTNVGLETESDTEERILPPIMWHNDPSYFRFANNFP